MEGFFSGFPLLIQFISAPHLKRKVELRSFRFRLRRNEGLPVTDPPLGDVYVTLGWKWATELAVSHPEGIAAG